MAVVVAVVVAVVEVAEVDSWCQVILGRPVDS